MTDPTRPEFTLAVVTSADGFIARAPNHPPQAWASPEEQALFFRDVEAADWSIMGRHTHEAADKPQRRRIILSRKRSGWQRPTQLWIDPGESHPADLATRVDRVHRLRRGLILGGTTVHDWFHAHRAIDQVHLTIEPVRFGTGLPVFTDRSGPADAVFADAGYVRISEIVLNDTGTRHLVFRPSP